MMGTLEIDTYVNCDLLHVKYLLNDWILVWMFKYNNILQIACQTWIYLTIRFYNDAKNLESILILFAVVINCLM